MKKNFILLTALLISLFAFTQCNHDNGEGDGNENSNQCAVTDFDGNCYDTVHIGNQVWMKSNLRTTHFRDGSAIPSGGNDLSSSIPYFYIPTTISEDDQSLLSISINDYDSQIHGLYYNAAAVQDSRGLCPAGWHVPSLTDWFVMEKHLISHPGQYFSFLQNYTDSDGENFYDIFTEYIDEISIDELNEQEGVPFTSKTLSSKTGWLVLYDDFDPDELESYLVPTYYPANNNSSGFSAYPAGYCYGQTVYGFGYKYFFWTSSLCGPGATWVQTCGDARNQMFPWPVEHEDGEGISVRCVKD